MSFMQKCCVFAIAVISSCILVENRSYNNGLIFYDLKTKQTLLPPTVSVSRGRSLAKLKFSEKGSIWSTFGKPCECTGPLCGCCVGIKVKQYNFDQKMCANVTYIQPKQEINLEMFLNENQSAKYAVSTRNPSPFCIPIMLNIPMSMCVQMSDVGLQGDNMHACMDFMVQLASSGLFEMHFQCMQMGAQGVQWVSPTGGPVVPPSQSKLTNRSEAESEEYYDEENENEIAPIVTVTKEDGSKQENDENKAEEELDYEDDLMDEETATEVKQSSAQDASKENEVLASEEMKNVTTEVVLNDITDELQKENMLTETSNVSSISASMELQNYGVDDITTENIFNVSDSNVSMELVSDSMEKTIEPQTLENSINSEGSGGDSLSLEDVVTSTTPKSATTSTTTPTPSVTTKTTEATPSDSDNLTVTVKEDNINDNDDNAEYEDEEEEEEGEEDSDNTDAGEQEKHDDKEHQSEETVTKNTEIEENMISKNDTNIANNSLEENNDNNSEEYDEEDYEETTTLATEAHTNDQHTEVLTFGATTASTTTINTNLDDKLQTSTVNIVNEMPEHLFEDNVKQTQLSEEMVVKVNDNIDNFDSGSSSLQQSEEDHMINTNYTSTANKTEEATNTISRKLKNKRNASKSPQQQNQRQNHHLPTSNLLYRRFQSNYRHHRQLHV
uniref:DUF4773 domain-containing protein n=2 Tax=Stomoxys calcitrans TaxID=35570 RepID=A0A1I8NMX6_STOCA